MSVTMELYPARAIGNQTFDWNYTNHLSTSIPIILANHHNLKILGEGTMGITHSSMKIMIATNQGTTLYESGFQHNEFHAVLSLNVGPLGKQSKGPHYKISHPANYVNVNVEIPFTFELAKTGNTIKLFMGQKFIDEKRILPSYDENHLAIMSKNVRVEKINLIYYPTVTNNPATTTTSYLPQGPAAGTSSSNSYLSTYMNSASYATSSNTMSTGTGQSLQTNQGFGYKRKTKKAKQRGIN